MKEYNPKSCLRWYGTLIGSATQSEFMIAAPTRTLCLSAAKQFYPQARVYDVQPISVTKRSEIKSPA